jgi:uncharacterized protein (TIGR02145 family)
MIKRFKNITQLILSLIISIGIFGCTEKDESISYKTGIMMDIDSNFYKTVIIGDQEWMAENLAVTCFRDSIPIDYVNNDLDWTGKTTSAYCIYQENSMYWWYYGCLYNWYAVNDPLKLAPKGWHVATLADWDKLITYMGGREVAGGKLKEIGFMHWNSPNVSATDEIEFAAQPGGYRAESGQYYSVGDAGYYWTANQEFTPTAFYHYMVFNNASIASSTIKKKYGFAVRLVKD